MTATFYGFTLWLQGDSPVQQPLTDTSGNIILWNGDIFHSQIEGENIPEELSDTQFIFKKLEMTETTQEICEILEKVNGPWSLIYYKKRLNVIIIGKDRFGRHSLLWNQSLDKDVSYPFVVSSSSTPHHQGAFYEIPTTNLFQICFSNNLIVKKVFSRKTYTVNKQLPTHELLSWATNILHDSTYSSDQIISQYLKTWGKEVAEFKDVLLASIKTRIFSQPMLCKTCVNLQNHRRALKCTHSKIAILFSGGLDSSVLAALTDCVWPQDESIDLLNVAFPLHTNKVSGEKFNVPDRLTGLQALKELQNLNPSRKWNFVEVCILYFYEHLGFILFLHCLL